MLIVGIFAVFKDHDAGAAGRIGNTGEDHIFTAQSGQFFNQGIDIGTVVFGAVVHPGEEGGLGDVGDDIISLGAQTLHGFHIVHIEDGIELAVVRHGGIHDLDAAFGGGVGEDIGHIADLLDAAQIAGVDGGKTDAFLHPMLTNGGHIVGEVTEGKAGEAGGVGGQNGRRQNAGLNAAGGQNGQRHRQGALADAGNILDREDLFVGHRKSLLIL